MLYLYRVTILSPLEWISYFQFQALSSLCDSDPMSPLLVASPRHSTSSKHDQAHPLRVFLQEFFWTLDFAST